MKHYSQHVLVILQQRVVTYAVDFALHIDNEYYVGPRQALPSVMLKSVTVP